MSMTLTSVPGILVGRRRNIVEGVPEGDGKRDLLVRITPLVTLRSLKRIMYALVRKVDEERLARILLFAYNVNGMVSEQIPQIGAVAELLPLSVDVDTRIPVFTLSADSLPMVKSRLGVPRIVSHVPFSEKSSVITRCL